MLDNWWVMLRNLFGLCEIAGWHDWKISPDNGQRICKKCGLIQIWKEASTPFDSHGWYNKFKG